MDSIRGNLGYSMEVEHLAKAMEALDLKRGTRSCPPMPTISTRSTAWARLMPKAVRNVGSTMV